MPSGGLVKLNCPVVGLAGCCTTLHFSQVVNNVAAAHNQHTPLTQEDERASRGQALVKALKWKGPVFHVSAAAGFGCRELMGRLMVRLETLRQEEATAAAETQGETPRGDESDA